MTSLVDAGDAQAAAPFALQVIERVETCSSTQDIAAKWLAKGAPHGSVVLSASQKGGRGRGGRSFLSAQGGLYLTVLLRPKMPVRLLPRLTLLAGVALLDACQSLDVVGACKWPNDLLLPAKTPGPLGPWRKAAGVLVEAQTGADGQVSALLGVGVNVARPQAGFGAELENLAGALDDLRPGLRMADVEAAALTALQVRLAHPANDAQFALCVDVLREHNAFLGKRVHVREDHLEGVALALEDDGALVLQDDAGVSHRVYAGDVWPVLAERP